MSALTSEDILFHSFAAIATISALLVVFLANPIYSALFLALAMSVLAALFFVLQAYFVAVAQLTVYAGAVMVLFVMVIMLFDLNREHEDIFKFSPVTVAKISGAALLCGFLIGVGWLGLSASQSNPASIPSIETKVTDLSKDLAKAPAKAPTPMSVQAGIPAEKQQTPSTAQTNETTNIPEGSTKGESVAQNQTTANLDEDLTEAEAANFVENSQGEKVGQPEKAKEEIAFQKEEDFGSIASLSQKLFSKYVFAFEAVSLLLLVAIVGTVGLAKSKGGTHSAR